MKRLLAIFLVCSAMTLTTVGCSNKKDDGNSVNSESSNVSGSEADESEPTEAEEASDDGETSNDDASGADSSDPVTIEAGQVDPDLTGEWYTEEMGGSLCFDENNKVLMSMDYTPIMYFNSDKNPVVYESEGTVEYDGTTLSVFIDSDVLGIESETDANGSSADSEVIDFLTLERNGEADPDSFDGEYILTGGVVYEDLSFLFSTIMADDSDLGLFMVIDGESLTLKMEVCQYTADGKRLEMFGSGIEIFDITNQEDAVFEYAISGDKLTLTDVCGEKMSCVKQ